MRYSSEAPLEPSAEALRATRFLLGPLGLLIWCLFQLGSGGQSAAETEARRARAATRPQPRSHAPARLTVTENNTATRTSKSREGLGEL